MTTTAQTIATANSTQSLRVLEDIVVFMPRLSFFGGQATLSASDLGIDAELIPKDIIALGTKAIVDQDKLNFFKTTRKAIQRRAKEKGSAFLGGFAMSTEEAKIFLQDVNPVLEELQDAIDQFLSEYDDLVEAWASSNPLWYSRIKEAAPSLDKVRRRFEVRMPFIKVSPPSLDKGLGDSGMMEEISGLTANILQEIASDVYAVWKDRGYGSQHIKSLLRRVADKAKALSFIDSDLSKLTTLIESTLTTFPTSGKIEGLEYLGLKSLMELLKNPTKTYQSIKSMQNIDLEIDDDEYQALQNSAANPDNATPDTSSLDNGQIEIFEEPATDDPFMQVNESDDAPSASAWAWA